MTCRLLCLKPVSKDILLESDISLKTRLNLFLRWLLFCSRAPPKAQL